MSGDRKSAPGVTEAVPILLAPVLDPKPWGGRRLADWGIALPDHDTIGEAHLTSPQATVIGGSLHGRTLDELVRADPAAWVGTRGLLATAGRPIFPLLIKLLGSETHLSIQVHPNDRAAAAAGIGTGKTEAYHILAADPESVLFLGLLPGVAAAVFMAACRRADGTAANFLRRVPVHAGMTVLIPAGTVHAPGAGITLYEIQQPSNVTFRLDDWGRIDAAGQPRRLHHRDGFAALDPNLRPDPLPPVALPGGGPGRELLVASPWFALERISGGAAPVVTLPAIESPQALTGLAGAARILSHGAPISIARGATAVIPAACAADLVVAADSIILRGWVPDVSEGLGDATLRSSLGDDASVPEAATTSVVLIDRAASRC